MGSKKIDRVQFKRAKVPDLEKAEEVRKLMYEPVKLKVGGQNSSEFSHAIGLSSEQQALQLCGTWYERVRDMNPKFAETMAAIIGLRRMYAVAYRELLEQVQITQAQLDTAAAGERLPEELADFAIQYSAWMAGKPFDEHSLMESVVHTMLPWFADVVDKHVQVEQQEALHAMEVRNEKRRNTPVPIGLKHTPTYEDTTLSRDRALVLVGWQNAITWLLNQITENVKKEQVATIRFYSQAPNAEDQSDTLMRLAPTAWHGATNDIRAFNTMVGTYVTPGVTGLTDLLIVDDLSKAFTAGFFGRNRFANAGDAHRRLKQWTDKLGAGFVGAVPTETPAPLDIAGSEFDQLRTFAHLRQVQVSSADADNYKVVVGHEAAVFLVPKATLDALGTVKVIMPSSTVTT